MKRAHLWLALALLISVNALVLVGIARNRSGRPDAELTLTERELPLRMGGSREENTGLSLTLRWRSDFVAEWFGAAKLTELGFLPRAYGKDPAEWNDRRRRALPKKAFVVLEYEGSAWRRYQEKKQEELAGLRGRSPGNADKAEERKRRKRYIESELQTGSRLFAVDTGLDPERLRSRYPDGARYLIVPAQLRMTYHVKNKVVTPQGYISSILVDELHLSRDLAAPLIALPNKGRPRPGYDYLKWAKPVPRYEVTVRWGRRHEPWVVAVKVLSGA
jgi:hypothetical protein